MPEKSTAGPKLVRHWPALVSRTILKRVSRAVGQAGTYFENQRHGQSRKICRWKLGQARYDRRTGSWDGLGKAKVS
jgi:hypothetical protein